MNTHHCLANVLLLKSGVVKIMITLPVDAVDLICSSQLLSGSSIQVDSITAT